MKWFGRKAARDHGRPFLLSGWCHAFTGEPWPRSYEAQVREAYLANPVAQRAVRLVAESVAWAPVYGLRESGAASRADRDRRPAGSEEAALARLATARVLEAAASHLLLHGNAFVQILQDAGGRPTELFALRPERVAIEAGPDGWPAAYLYKLADAKQRIAGRDGLGRPGVVHVRNHHPLDDHYGLGCLGAASGAVAIHNAASKWNKALLDNAARPSGALVHDGDEGVPLSADQFDRLKSELEAQFAGAGNAGRPMLLDGALTWQAMSLTPADMDFAALKAAAARDIALAFGVPPLLLGLPGDSTYANYREANRALWRLTVLPLAEKILAPLSDALATWMPGLRLAIDIDQVTALSEDRERLWRQVNAATFLTDEEKREMLGFERTKR
jgi:HK97 family phage portal protein